MKSVIIPDGVMEIRYRAFSGCYELTNVTIPNSVINIEDFAFNGCAKLKEIKIPNGLSVIKMGVFCSCDGLKSVTIPNGVTSIEDSAFSGRDMLNVTIPKSVKRIGKGVLWGCKDLTTVTFSGSKQSWQNISKDSFWNDVTGDFVIVCIDGKLDKNGNEIV